MTILNRRVPLLLTMAGAAIMAALLVIPWAAHAQNDATAPRNLTASIVDDGIALDWDTPTENADTVTGYQMLRRDPNEDAVGVFTIIENNTGDDATSYTDTEATTAGQSYTYRVKAWRDEALSNWSNYVRVNLPEEQGATPSSNSDRHRDTVPDAHGNANSGAHADAYTSTHGNADAGAHGDTDADAHQRTG